MHLYQHGVDLTLISQWLDHVRYETTLIYAKADTEHKRRAMENANKNSPLGGKLNSERFTISDDDMLKRLYGLKWYPKLFNSNFFGGGVGLDAAA